MVIVDGLESLSQVSGMSTASVASLREDCLQQLTTLAFSLPATSESDTQPDMRLQVKADTVSVNGFAIKRGSADVGPTNFRFEAPTTALNTMRVLRGSQLPKAILLEGSPGVGKTSLVSALAGVAGHRLQRINLSDQTDLIDLFGSDLPVEGGKAGEFQWRDAAFLDAMQKGDWVLLDEMNLASQTVLEGLNAVLDHRGSVYIPELGRSFARHSDFRVFAAQNPLQQGGGRKGLPKSFLNRFTKVYLQEHTPEDLMLICKELHPMPAELVQQMIAFNEVIRDQTMVSRLIGREGSPWEFNLRDLARWFKLLSSANGLESTSHPVEHLRLVYLQRFRNERDRQAVSIIFDGIFGVQASLTRPTPFLTPSWHQIGHSLVKRSTDSSIDATLAQRHLDVAESVLKCVEMGWLVILAGENGCGKRSLVRAMAAGAGRALGEFAMHPGVDTSEILGSFEQQDIGRQVRQAIDAVLALLENASDIEPTASSIFVSLRQSIEAVIEAVSLESISTFGQLAQQLVDQVSTRLDTTRAASALSDLAKANHNATGFAWVDGQLLDAIRQGGWFLISDANLCSPSVLDRLNSLCETDGTLVMSEKGSASGVPEVIRPHEDFRLFMTYDPRHGELSRAMRNRGVELHIDAHHEIRELTADELAVELSAAKGSAPGVMVDHSLLQSALDLHSSVTPVGDTIPMASLVANTVAMQSRLSTSYLERFGKTADGQAIELYASAANFIRNATVSDHLSQLAQLVIDAQGVPVNFTDALVSASSSAVLTR
jgi:midasin